MSASDDAAMLASAVVGTFGEDLLYHPADGGQAVAVRGIFRTPHLAVDQTTGGTISTKRPAVDVRRVDLPEAPVPSKSRVTARGETWFVEDVQEDGEGMLTLVLTTFERVD